MRNLTLAVQSLHACGVALAFYRFALSKDSHRLRTVISNLRTSSMTPRQVL